MEDFSISVTARAEKGKAAMRRMRQRGLVPGVVYGGSGAPTSIAMPGNDLIKHLNNEAFYSTILTIDLNGSRQQAVLKSVQRDPASTAVVHVDFLRVDAAHEIRMSVPLHFINEESSPGKKAGGMVTHAMTEVEITCLPKDLPEFLEVDLGALEIGESIHMSAIKLPQGVSLTVQVEEADHDHVIAAVQEIHIEVDEADEEAEAVQEPDDSEPV